MSCHFLLMAMYTVPDRSMEQAAHVSFIENIGFDCPDALGVIKTPLSASSGCVPLSVSLSLSLSLTFSMSDESLASSKRGSVLEWVVVSTPLRMSGSGGLGKGSCACGEDCCTCGGPGAGASFVCIG